MKKELLTAEGIKKDLYKHFFSKVRDILLAILIIPIANIIILNVILFFCDPCSSFELVFSIIFCATCFLLVSYDLTTVIIGMISIKKENYTITNDWVVDKKEKTYGTRVSTAKPYRLYLLKVAHTTFLVAKIIVGLNCLQHLIKPYMNTRI